uniref:Hexosyltransferase n=1 Tax=Pelagomonas calceolata TaxID=35677 RepID=A0A7S4E582_9STRA
MGQPAYRKALLLCLAAATEATKVSERKWKAAADEALATFKPIRKSVNRKCFFSLMSSTPPRDGLAMASAAGRVAAFSHVPLRLCKVDHGAAVVSTKTALLVAVPSLSDLERSGTWQAFLNKAAYCRRTNRPLYVFVGVPQLLHSRLDAPWAKCRERGSSASLKAVALLSLYEDPNPPDRVLYMEGTAFLSDLAFGDDEDAPEAYFALAPAAELVMRRDLDPSIFLTKRSAWSSQVLALWWRGQCGADDALPLASTLYASWSAATDGKLEFEKPTFETRACLCGNQPVSGPGVEVDAAIQDERAVNLSSTQDATVWPTSAARPSLTGYVAGGMRNSCTPSASSYS